MLRRVAKFAVAVTVAAPGFSRAIDDTTVARWAHAGGVGFLIGAAWTEGEAQARGVLVSDADARAAMAAPHDGLTRGDRIYEARIELLRAGLHGPVGQAAAQSVTQAQIDAYVAAHPKFQPPQRSVYVMRLADRRTAEAALRALKRGATLERVSRRYARRTTGLRFVRPGDLEGGVGRAVFKAVAGAYVRYGSVVIRVRTIEPPEPLGLEQQNASAWEVLASDAQERAIAAFDAQIAVKWRPATTCAPALQTRPECGNSPTGQ